MTDKKAKELNNDIQSNGLVYSSNPLDEYSFAVGKGKDRKNVIVKLKINPDDDISQEAIAKGLVQYINVFEKIIISQCGNKRAII